MKKRVLSALLALCMACTLAGNVWAAEETEPTPAPSAGVEAQTVEPQTVEPTPSAEPTQAPAPSPDATAEPEATPEPSAAPDATVAPTATPAPTEAPEATDAPAATATPDPTGEPAATATPAPTEVPAATATPEPSDAPEATAAPAVAYVAPVQTAEDQQINVHVDVPEGAFAENVAPTLHAQLITGETEEEQAELDKAAAQVAEQTGAAFDGMLALDVYFTDANAEDPEQEIEPALPVSVRFELSENVLPEGYDPATLAVHHLAEEKDAAGEPVTDENGEAAVTVETVANAVTDDAEVPGVVALSDAAAEAAEAPAEVARIADLPAPETAATPADEQAAAEAEQALTDPAIVAEFEVESFSTFVLTYSSNRLSITVVNESYEEIGTNTSYSSESIGTSWTDVEDIASKIIEANGISEYEFRRAEYQYSSFGGRHKVDVNWIKYKTGLFRGFKYSSEVEPSNDSNGDELNVNGSNDSHLYFIFEEKEETPQSGFYIDETIAENGLLTATFDESVDVTDKVFNYVWYRRAPDGDWVRIDRTVASGDYYNMDAENGTSGADSINAVLDGYVADKENTTYLYDYKVEAYEVVEGEQQAESSYEAELQMPYYYAIQNGDFEKPENLNSDGGEFRVQDTNSEIMWKTTETTGEIELVTKGDNAEKYYGLDTGNWNNSGDYEGHDNQIAELNAKEEESSLYQDIATVPGTRLYWSLDHRARDNTSSIKDPYTSLSEIKQDTMYVLIMSAEEADELLTSYRGSTAQEKVRNYINDNPGAINEYIWEISDSAEWGSHGGDYVVPENQFLTRFFFVAGDTVFSGLPDQVRDQYDSTAEPKSVGNFIDNVTFNKNVPPPSAQHGNLQITKQVVGIQYLPGDYQVEFTLSKDGEQVDMVAIQATEFENNAASVTILNLEPGAYTVTETKVSTVEGYALTQTSAPQTVTVEAGKTAEANFTNTYEDQSSTEPVVSDPTIRKYVDAKDDGTYDLSLDVTGTTGKEEIPINVLYVLDESYSMMWDMNGNYPGTGGENPSGDNKYPEDENQQPIHGRDPYNYSYVRFNAAKQAIDRLNSVLKADDNLDVQVALVTFAQDHNDPADYAGEYTTWKDLKTAGIDLPGSAWETFASGTNYENALTQAQRMIDDLPDDRKEAETIVVFVTDGEPNWPKDDPKGSAAEAMTELKCDRFYAVGVGSDIGNEYLAGLIKNAQQDIVTDSFQSGDTTALVNYFNQIAADIAGTDTHNVTIVDELSEYAELTSTTAKPQIKIKDADGNEVTVTGPLTESEPNADGVVTYQYSFTDKTVASSASETTQTLTYTYHPAETYGENKDNAHPVITLDFPEDYELTKDWTYTITLPIRPTAAASNYLSENDTYPHKGERDKETGIITDVPGSSETDWTSTGKEGFFSNTEATLKYDSNDTTDQEKTYLKPVIQVNTADLTITKAIVVDGDENADLSKFIGQTFDFTVKNEAGKVVGTASITWGQNNNNNTATVSDLPIGNYTVSETNPASVPTGYTFVGYGGDVSVTVSENEGGATVTNHYKHDDVTLTVSKTVGGNMGDTTKDFNFTLTVTNAEGKTLTGEEYTKIAKTIKITPLDEGETEQSAYSFTNRSVQFQMHSGQQMTVDLPYGCAYAVSEETDGYSPAVAVTGDTDAKQHGVNVSGTMDADIQVAYTNTMTVQVPTGLDRNNTPFALMVTASGIAGLALVGGILARRARRRREW